MGHRPPAALRFLQWRWARSLLSVAVLGLAAWLVSLRASDLHQAVRQLGRSRGSWVVAAVGFEAASMVLFARLQQRLVRSGGSRIGFGTMAALTVAGNAITGTLPGGVAWAAAWEFDQLGRRGVSRFVRVWTFLVAGAFSSFALFLVIAAGVLLAGSHGPVAGLRWLVVVLAAIPVAALLAWLGRRSRPVRSCARRFEDWVESGSRSASRVEGLRVRFRAVELPPAAWVEVTALALGNWLADALVLFACAEALGVRLPWTDVLVVYGLTQVAAVLPVSVGGIGVVAVSMAALLTAYGVTTSAAIATVVLYRLASFWVLIPVGWSIWGVLEVQGHRSRRPGAALSAQPLAERSMAAIPSRKGSGSEVLASTNDFMSGT